MKVFIAKTDTDTPQSFVEIVKYLRTKKDVKIFLIGERGYDWEIAQANSLEGVVKAPSDLRSLIDKKD